MGTRLGKNQNTGKIIGTRVPSPQGHGPHNQVHTVLRYRRRCDIYTPVRTTMTTQAQTGV